MQADPFPTFPSGASASKRTTEPDKAESNASPNGRRARNFRPSLIGWIQENTFSPEWLPERLRHLLFGYLAAVLIEGVATGLVLLILSLFPSFSFYGVLIVLGVVLIAIGWGAGPGLFGTLLGTVVLWFLVLPPHFSWLITDPADAVGLVLYVVVGASISLLAGQNERARRQAEQVSRLLTLVEARSRAEAERLSTVLEVMPSAVLITSPEGKLLAMNRATRTLWGADIAVGTDFAQYSQDNQYRVWHAGTGTPLSTEEWTLVHALTSGRAVLNDELEIEAVDGQRRVILNSAAPIQDRSGTIIGAVISAQEISDLRRLEREVTERAQELEAVFEAMTDGVFVYDARGYIVRVNAAGRQVLGPDAHPHCRTIQERAADQSPRDQDGRPLPLERLPGIRILRGEVLTGSQAVDMYLPTPTGDLVALNTTGTPLRDAEGSITGAVVVTRDVTERHQLEREAAERAQELEAVFEAMTDGIAVLDAQGMLIRTNRAFRTLHGVEPDSDYLTLPLEQRLTTLALADDQGRPLAKEARPITRLLHGEIVPGVDVIIKRLDGREIVLNVGGAPIRDERGHITGCVEVFRDVTTRHHLEERTRDTLDALVAMAEAIVAIRPSTLRLAPDADPASRAAAAGTTLALVARHLAQLTQSALGCRYVSLVARDPASDRLHPITAVGLAPREQQTWWTSWAVPPGLQEHYGLAIAAQLVAGSLAALDRDQLPVVAGSLLFGAQSGRIVPMRLGEELVGILVVAYAEPDHAFSGEELALTETLARLGALVLERDQLLRGWAETRASELALAETKAQMDTFLGIASHELKTPLTSLKLSLQLAERRLQALTREAGVGPARVGPAGREQARLEGAVEQLGRTARQMERLERLVNDLLEVSRIQAGKLELQPDTVDLVALVAEAVREQSEAAPARRIQVSGPGGGGEVLVEVLVEVDAGRIEQVVTNFLTNALKYSPADRPVGVGIEVVPPAVAPAEAGERQQARVWVRDEGPGLPGEEQEQIWERFHRARGVEVQTGTGVGLGLGLYISRMIVERHHGQVGVESVPGQGATFWFTLPLAPPGDDAR